MTSTVFANYLVQTTLALSVLIGLILMIRLRFARVFGSRAAYALWAIPFARLVFPPVPEGWSLFGHFHFFQSEGAEGLAREMASMAADGRVVLTRQGAGLDGISQVAMPAGEPSVWSTAMVGLPSPLQAGICLWALGAVIVFAVLMKRQLTTARLISLEAVDAGPKLQTRAMDVCRMVGINPEKVSVRTSFISSGPLVSGLARPTVLLPAWFESDYSAQEQGLALAHELMHIKRRDLWALFAASLMVALQWFNPLVWRALAAFRTDQEAACDADVLCIQGVSPRGYGQTLLKALRTSTHVAQPVQAASLSLNHALYERISQMKTPLPSRARRQAATLLTTSLGAGLLLVSACAVSNAQTTELDGAAQSGPIEEAEVTRRTIIIDPGTIETEVEGLEEGAVKMQIITRTDRAEGDGDAVGIFVSGEGHEDLNTAAREFAEERRRLEHLDGDHSANIEALERDFEARVAELTGTIEADANVQVFRFDHETEWTEHVEGAQNEGALECEEGQATTRTVIVEKNGERTENSFVSCEAFTTALDVDHVMSRLRTSGRLTEERLAEIEARLEETRGALGRAGQELDIELERMDQDLDGAN